MTGILASVLPYRKTVRRLRLLTTPPCTQVSGPGIRTRAEWGDRIIVCTRVVLHRHRWPTLSLRTEDRWSLDGAGTEQDVGALGQLQVRGRWVWGEG